MNKPILSLVFFITLLAISMKLVSTPAISSIYSESSLNNTLIKQLENKISKKEDQSKELKDKWKSLKKTQIFLQIMLAKEYRRAAQKKLKTTIKKIEESKKRQAKEKTMDYPPLHPQSNINSSSSFTGLIEKKDEPPEYKSNNNPAILIAFLLHKKCALKNYSEGSSSRKRKTLRNY